MERLSSVLVSELRTVNRKSEREGATLGADVQSERREQPYRSTADRTHRLRALIQNP